MISNYEQERVDVWNKNVVLHICFSDTMIVDEFLELLLCNDRGLWLVVQ